MAAAKPLGKGLICRAEVAQSQPPQLLHQPQRLKVSAGLPATVDRQRAQRSELACIVQQSQRAQGGEQSESHEVRRLADALPHGLGRCPQSTACAAAVSPCIMRPRPPQSKVCPTSPPQPGLACDGMQGVGWATVVQGVDLYGRSMLEGGAVHQARCAVEGEKGSVDRKGLQGGQATVHLGLWTQGMSDKGREWMHAHSTKRLRTCQLLLTHRTAAVSAGLR